MFKGTIPQDVRRIMHQVVKDWPCTDVYVGCSGNFTVERVLDPLKRFALHGNDVSLYTSALGAYFAGDPVNVSPHPDAPEELRWATALMDGRVEKVASVMLATSLMDAMSPTGEMRLNKYYERLLAGYHEEWGRLHSATCEKLVETGLALASFTCGDVCAWVKGLPKDQGFISYPPFYVGGYETLFKKLDFLFEWAQPTYPVMTDQRKEAYLADIIDRKYWLFAVDKLLPTMRPHLTGISQTSNRAAPFYMYASGGPARVVAPRQAMEPVLMPRLMPGDTLGDEISLVALNEKQFCSLRSKYMNAMIRPGMSAMPIGIAVDGLLVGCYAFSQTDRQISSPAFIYLISDFCVAPTDYPRLSKLVLYAALSRESKLLAERLTRRRVRFAVTTAFTDRPVSMKYRGVFSLVKRRENKVEEQAYGEDAKKYMLNYQAAIGGWSLAEGLIMWKKKHGKKV